MHVILFDIDGTLIDTGGAGGAALLDAFRRLFGIDQPGRVQFSGRTDRAIGRDLFALHGLEDSEANWARLRQEYLVRLAEWLPRRKGFVLPGIGHLLERLSRLEHVAVGLLTGNLRDGARLKLQHYGLYHHFAFGGYGDEHFDRNHVAESALAAAYAHRSGQFQNGNFWVVGDTPLDIRCARWIKARILAVATGTHPRHELAAHEPDLLFDDLADVERFMSLVSEVEAPRR
jgi:phosphoglycolate phosphatase-like HAD superfamily hydrolase